MKPLTKEQNEQFTQLYLQGYSASLIFEKLGQPYPQNKYHLANGRMRRYRMKLGLPIRGSGSQPRFRRSAQPRILQELRRKRRVKKLKTMIPRWQKKILQWQCELEQLKKLESVM